METPQIQTNRRSFLRTSVLGGAAAFTVPIDFADVGYLNYCGQTGMGETDLAKIEVLGPALKDHIKPYKLASNINDQLIWKRKAAKA